MTRIIVKTKSPPSRGLTSQTGLHVLTFKNKSLKLSSVLDKSGLNLDETKIGFCAINGARCTREDWVFDGDIIEIFPH